MRCLLVAEKPSIAKSISGILSGGEFTTRDTGTRYIKNYEFSYRFPPSATFHDFVVTAVAGHLTEVHLPENTKSWQSCDPFILFDAPVTRSVNPNQKAIEQNLMVQARRAQQVMIWTDCDREGEHIGSEIVSVCRKANANIVVKRARFSAIIPAQIHNACRNPVNLDMQQASAVEARMELDLRVGAAMTRLQSLNLQASIQELEGNIVSYGPCQFPTLGFVVEQYERVQNFIAETFWHIYVALEREESTVEFSWRRNRLFDHEAAFVIYELCVEEPEATVLSVQTKPASKWKPLPLTTVELQKSGSRLLHLTPKRILDVCKIAESLYQKGFVSYPRTETDQFDPQFNFHELIEKHVTDTEWGNFASGLMNGAFEKPRNGKKNDKAHPPIHVTAHVSNLTGDDKRVYELITRRFLACCSRNAVGRQTSVEADIAGEHFSASGLVVLERNYLEVYPYDKWTGNHLPDFAVGEKFMPSICELREGTTSRPNLLTEADLVNLMDKNGIGTDATIAEHIAKIIDREYVMKRREGRIEYLVPSTLGIGLVEGYNDIGFEKSLSKPHLRRETEQRMSAICEGQRSKREVLDETLNEYRDMFMRTKIDFAHIVAAVSKYMQGQGAAQQDPEGQQGPPGFHDGDGDDDNDDAGFPPPGGGNTRGRGRGRGRGAAATARGRGRDRNVAARRSRPTRNDDGNNHGGSFPGPHPSGGNATPNCRCDQPAIERSVTRETENKGRRFYACSKPRDDGSCGFFEWADESGDTTVPKKRPLSTTTNNQSRNTRPKTDMADRLMGHMGGQQDDAEVRCQCGLVAASHSVSKDGPNKGRLFYSCSKVSKMSQCKFFKWADENGSAAVQASQDRKAPRGGQSGGCFTCGSEDHWSNACPSRCVKGSAQTARREAGNDSCYSCYRCGEQGHYSSACTKDTAQSMSNAGGSAASGVCFKCNEPGHRAATCPSIATGTGKRGRGGPSRSRGRGRGRGARVRGSARAVDEWE